MGEYEKTYIRIEELEQEINTLEKEFGIATKEQKEYISEDIALKKMAIGECEGYIRELEFIDGDENY